MSCMFWQLVQAYRDKAIAVGLKAGRPLFFPDALEDMSRDELIEERDRLRAESNRNAQEAFDLLDIANAQANLALVLADLTGAMEEAGAR